MLALHIPEPTNDHDLYYRNRNQWLLASRGYFGGHVPHDLHNAVKTSEGRQIVIDAIDSLMDVLAKAPPMLNGPTLDVLGIDGTFHDGFDTRRLIEVGNAFKDSLAGRITCTAESTDFMPGSKWIDEPTDPRERRRRAALKWTINRRRPVSLDVRRQSHAIVCHSR